MTELPPDRTDESHRTGAIYLAARCVDISIGRSLRRLRFFFFLFLSALFLFLFSFLFAYLLVCLLLLTPCVSKQRQQQLDQTADHLLTRETTRSLTFARIARTHAHITGAQASCRPQVREFTTCGSRGSSFVRVVVCSRQPVRPSVCLSECLSWLCLYCAANITMRRLARQTTATE